MEKIDCREFGEIRFKKINERIYYVGRDVSKAAGLVNSRDAIAKHCKYHQSVKIENKRFIMLSATDASRLIAGSKNINSRDKQTLKSLLGFKTAFKSGLETTLREIGIDIDVSIEIGYEVYIDAQDLYVTFDKNFEDGSSKVLVLDYADNEFKNVGLVLKELGVC